MYGWVGAPLAILASSRIAVASRRAAGGVLDVRLELEDRVVELPVALARQIDERRPHGSAPGRLRGQAGVGETVEHLPIADQEARVQQGREVLRVVRLGLRELGELPHLVSDLQAEIPERMQDRPEKPFFGGADRAVHDDQQVDVGVLTEVAASVTAQRDQRGRLVRELARGFIYVLQDAVDAGSVAAQRTDARAGANGRGGQLFAGFGQTPGQVRQCAGRPDGGGRRPVIGMRHRGPGELARESATRSRPGTSITGLPVGRVPRPRRNRRILSGARDRKQESEAGVPPTPALGDPAEEESRVPMPRGADS